MAPMPERHHPTPEERDEPLVLPLPPEVAIPAFLAVDPESEPVEPELGSSEAGPSPKN